MLTAQPLLAPDANATASCRRASRNFFGATALLLRAGEGRALDCSRTIWFGVRTKVEEYPIELEQIG